MTVLSHKRGTMHSIFKICISRNMKCDKTVGFLKYSHIYIYINNVLRIYVHVYIIRYSSSCCGHFCWYCPQSVWTRGIVSFLFHINQQYLPKLQSFVLKRDDSIRLPISLCICVGHCPPCEPSFSSYKI